MSDVQGGNLVFTGVFDGSDIERGFQKAKREIEAMSGVLTKGADSIQDYFDDMADSLSVQKDVVRQLEQQYKELNKQIEKVGPGAGRQALVTESAALKKELDGEKMALEILNEANKKLNSGYSELSKQLRFLQAEMIRMEQAGQGNTAEFRAIQAEAVRLSTSIKDVQSSVKKLGDGQSALKGVNEAFRGLIGAVSAGTGAVAMFSGENENLQRIMVRLQSAMAMAIGMQEVSMALDKNSAFQTVTLTKVKSLYTAALTRMTAALGGSAAAARVVMGILTGGLTLAIGAAIVAWDRYNAKQEEAKKKLQERFDLERDAKTAMYEARMELENNIRSIQTFNGTKEQEKKKISELNEKYGETFGYFKTLGEWYDILIKKGEVYIESLYLQAEAQAYLNKKVEADVKLEEIRDTPAENFTTLPERMWARAKAGPFKTLSNKDINDTAKTKAEKDAEAASKSYDEKFKDRMARLSNLSMLNGLGGHEDPNKGGQGGKKGKEKDPFLKELEDKKKAYEEYAKAINANDEIVRNSAEKTYAELLKGGKSYADWLKNERNKVTSGNADLLKKWNAAIADADTETITGKLEKQIKDILDHGINKTKDKIAELEKVGSDILPGDPLKIEKKKLLQTGLTQLRKQSLQEEKKLLEETLKEYGGFLQEKLDFDLEYNEKKAALNKKLTEQITEEEKQAVLEAMANLDAEQAKIRNKSKIKGVETKIQTAQYKLEKDLFEIEKGRYKWRADRDKDRLEKQKKYNQTLQDLYKQLQDLDPTKENLEKIKEILEGLGIEFDKISHQIKNTKNDKLFEMLEGIEGIAGALAGLDGSMGEVFQSISRGVASVNQTIKTFNDDTLSSSEKNFAAAATIIEGVVSLINMATTASKNRKEKEREFYQNQIALAHEYALALNEQLLLQSKLNGSGFVRNYAGEINDAFSAATDAFTKYQEAMEKLEDGKAKTDLKNAIDWGNVGKGAASGAATGAVIGSVVPVIGNVVGAVVGAVVGGVVGLFGGKKKKDVLGGLLEVFPELVDGAGNLNKELAQTLINTNQVDESTKQLLQNSLDWADAVEKANEQIKNVVVDLAGDLGNSLKVALVEAFRAGEDAGTRMFEAASKSLESFVENLVYSTIFSKTFKDFEDRLAQSLNPNGGDGNVVDDYDWLMKQMAEGKETFNAALQQIKDYADSQGFDMWSPSSDAMQKGMAGAVKGMSQESATIMGGHLNKHTVLLTDSNEIWKQHLLATYQIRDNTDDIKKSNRNIETTLNSIKSKSDSDPLRAAGLG